MTALFGSSCNKTWVLPRIASNFRCYSLVGDGLLDVPKGSALRKLTANGGQGSGRPTHTIDGAVRGNAVPAFRDVREAVPYECFRLPWCIRNPNLNKSEIPQFLHLVHFVY